MVSADSPLPQTGTLDCALPSALSSGHSRVRALASSLPAAGCRCVHIPGGPRVLPSPRTSQAGGSASSPRTHPLKSILSGNWPSCGGRCTLPLREVGVREGCHSHSGCSLWAVCLPGHTEHMVTSSLSFTLSISANCPVSMNLG